MATSDCQVSVIMAVHNNASYVADAIESILRQTFKDFEFLITDDRSDDGSSELINSYAKKDSRIVVYRNEMNRGLAESLNYMLKSASGKWVARMDGDDISIPDRLKYQIQFMQNGNLDLCGSWAQTIGYGGSRTMRMPTDDSAIRVCMLFQSPFIHPSVMMRTSAVRKFRYDTDAKDAEDYDLWVRLSPFVRMGNVPATLLQYRIHDRQVSSSTTSSQRITAIRVRRRYLKDLKLPLSSHEMEALVHVRAKNGCIRPKHLADLERALEKVRNHFAFVPEIQRLVARQWYLECVRSANRGFSTWRWYRRSNLKEGFGEAVIDEAALWVLCWLRIRYQSKPYRFFQRIINFPWPVPHQ